MYKLIIISCNLHFFFKNSFCRNYHILSPWYFSYIITIGFLSSLVIDCNISILIVNLGNSLAAGSNFDFRGLNRGDGVGGMQEDSGFGLLGGAELIE